VPQEDDRSVEAMNAAANLAHTKSADHGDLTAENAAEDYGPLYL